MEIQDVMKMLAKNGVYTLMHYDESSDQCFIDLNTQAKSHLYLYDDGMLYGRYSHEKQLDLEQDPEELLIELCHEFNNSLHGRNYCQEGWAELCREKGIELDMLGF